MRTANERKGRSLPRNRPEPRRLVPLSFLTRTNSRTDHTNEGSIVHHLGAKQQADQDVWTPLQTIPETIELSPNSWNGLHARMMESMNLAEVA